MAHKVLSSDMAELINAMKLAQQYSNTLLDGEYRKSMLKAAHVLAMDSKNLLDAVDSARKRRIWQTQKKSQSNEHHKGKPNALGSFTPESETDSLGESVKESCDGALLSHQLNCDSFKHKQNTINVEPQSTSSRSSTPSHKSVSPKRDGTPDPLQHNHDSTLEDDSLNTSQMSDTLSEGNGAVLYDVPNGVSDS